MRRLLLTAGFVCMSATTAYAHAAEDKDGFLPQNEMWIGAEDLRIQMNGVTEDSFNRVINAVQTLYKPIVAKLGGNLVIQGKWTDGTVNAQASRQNGVWLVEIFGGIARHPATNDDSLALITCHEIGHHIGGAPRFTSAGGTWASVEGQSDYFSTSKCLRKFFRSQGAQPVDADPAARAACQAAFNNSADENICEREAMAGQSAANLMWQLNGQQGAPPSFVNQDPSRVTTVYEGHPAAQCRMDTYFNAALCTASEDQPTVDCTDLRSRRPSCWYPNTSNPGPNPTPTPTPTPGPGPGPTPPPTPTPVPSQTQAPRLNGLTDLGMSNMSLPVAITFNLSNIPGAGGAYLEFSKVDTPFTNPNSTDPDPNRLGYRLFRGSVNGMQIIPGMFFNRAGTYYIRVIPLEATLHKPVGSFSNSSALHLTPGVRRFSPK